MITSSLHKYPHIAERCFVNVPFARLKTDLLRLVLDNRIRPEIGLTDNVLHDEPEAEFVRIAELLKSEGLACTLHAPFHDLIPGALDPGILAASRAKLQKAFELIPVFEPQSIVCHLNFEADKHGGTKEQRWFDQSLATWQGLLVIAESHNTAMMLENTYEKTPAQLKRMLTALDSPFARFCLDVGHVMAFARNSWQDWLPELEPWLGQLHLHDNDGRADSHLAVGEGIFDFKSLFAYLSTRGHTPLVTLEPHKEDGVTKSFANINRMGILDHMTTA